LSADNIKTYCRISTLVNPLPTIPDLTNSWNSTGEALRNHLKKCESDEFINPDILRRWVDLIKVIADNEPRFLKQIAFPGKFTADLVRLLDLIQEEFESSALLDTYEELEGEADRRSSIAELLLDLAEFFTNYTEHLEKLSQRLDNAAEQLKEEAMKLGSNDVDDYYDWDSVSDHKESGQEFDVDSLFADL
jgi:hypothetical protein